MFNGLQGLMAVRSFIKNQILVQCQNNIPRLKPDLPPQVCAATTAQHCMTSA
jgi:hypothetical protein